MRTLQADLDMAIMYITHNLGVIAEMAERVAVMYLGKVVELAGVEAVFFEPRHPYTQGLLKSIPHLDDVVKVNKADRRLWTITGTVPDPYSRIKGCSFFPRCPEYMPGLCDQDVPPVIEILPGHLVACHLYAA
jgi:peptide/nickel transport system ATP-binding protein